MMTYDDFMFTALIPAHNEAATIGQALNSLRSAAPPPNPILVIADPPTPFRGQGVADATAASAQNIGAWTHG